MQADANSESQESIGDDLIPHEASPELMIQFGRVSSYYSEH